MPKISEIYQCIERALPPSLSCDWDNDGLMVCASPEAEVKKILFALDITPAVAEYAVSIGLILDSEAVDCWDNPIRAGAHCIYLERDIQSRLNRYTKDEDITDVWIWAENIGNNCYEIYIGYA